ncbi:unnamed protein product, partial [Amoebophrya sp. A25]
GVVLRRDGFRNIVRLNSTVTAVPATYTETRLYINELPRFTRMYELPGCNTVGSAAITGLKLVYHRTLLSPGVRCLLVLVDEDEIAGLGVTTTTTPDPRVTYGFLDGNVHRTVGLGVKTDNETFVAPTAELISNANGTTTYRDIEPAAQKLLAPSVKLEKHSHEGGLDDANQGIQGLVLRYSVLDSTLQEHSPPATIRFSIPPRELAFTSPRYDWGPGVEGFKRCEPWDIGKTTFAAAVGFDSVERCKAECDNYSLQNPRTKYDYNPAGDASANLALSTPACVAITYYAAQNPFKEAEQPLDLTAFRNGSVVVSEAGFDLQPPFVI